uniref:Uncharacterized protein n=1 Tax=Heterorhabditis bacteriophora TaxID=37862 RepID=A0A1I7WDX1_HETBA
MNGFSCQLFSRSFSSGRHACGLLGSGHSSVLGEHCNPGGGGSQNGGIYTRNAFYKVQRTPESQMWFDPIRYIKCNASERCQYSIDYIFDLREPVYIEVDVTNVVIMEQQCSVTYFFQHVLNLPVIFGGNHVHTLFLIYYWLRLYKIMRDVQLFSGMLSYYIFRESFLSKFVNIRFFFPFFISDLNGKYSFFRAAPR